MKNLDPQNPHKRRVGRQDNPSTAEQELEKPQDKLANKNRHTLGSERDPFSINEVEYDQGRQLMPLSGCCTFLIMQ